MKNPITEIQLKAMNEYVGVLKAFSTNENHLILSIYGEQHRLRMDSALAILLDKSIIGKTIAILVTGIPAKPYFVRILERPSNNDHNQPGKRKRPVRNT